MTRLNLVGKGNSNDIKKEAVIKKKKEVVDMKTTDFYNYFLALLGWLCFGLSQFVELFGFNISITVLAKSALAFVARALP